MKKLKPEEDAFGQEMWACYKGEEASEIVERDDGFFNASPKGPRLYFSEYEDWDLIDRKAMEFVKGRVLDIGCGAGRHSLHLQKMGFDVLGIESLDTGMTSLEKALLSPTQVFRHVRGVGRKSSTCDAVLITSSAWPTLTVIQTLEDDLGKPVVSSSMGQIWWPLKELGIKQDIKGYVKLLGTVS